MVQKVLVTGITGFVGSHLIDYLLTLPDVEIYGVRRWRSRTEHIEHLPDAVTVMECDMRDLTSVKRIVEAVRPDKIFHLAAQSYVPTSWHAPAECLTTNIIGNLNLLEAVRDSGIDPWIQIAGSSEEYGLVHEHELPITEENPLRPLSPYGVSKVAQDLLSYQYFKSYGLKVVRTRGFNHTGPRRGDVFVSSNFARQIAMIERRRQEPAISVGNLDARRDFTDVRDMVRAYWLALEKCEPGEVYNISSGKTYSIRELLDLLLGMTTVKVDIKQDPSRMRPSDVPLLLGDSTKFRAKTGWEPSIPFEQTLADILDYWRERV